MNRGNFAVVAGVVYLVAGVVAPAALAVQIVGHPIDSLRSLAARFDLANLLFVGAILLLIVASFVMAAILLVRRRGSGALFATGIVMATLAAAFRTVPAPVWVAPLPFLWLAYREPEDRTAVRPESPATPSRMKQGLYIACLALVGGGALLHLLHNDLVPAPYLPVISRFEDPMEALIDFLRVKPIVDLLDGTGTVQRALSFLVSLGIVALVIRRIASMREARTVAVPETFAGFPYGLMWAALLLAPLIYFLQYILRPPENLAVLCVFLAFLLTDLADFRNSKRPRVAPLDGAVAPSSLGTPRRRPIFTVLSVILPLLGAGCLAALVILGQGAHSLGPLILGMIAVTFACLLGLIANVIALARRERWIPAQVASFLVNFGVSGLLGLAAFADLFRFG